MTDLKARIMQVGAGELFVLGVAVIPVILLWIFGGLFLRKLTAKQLGFSHPFKQTWKILLAWILPPWRRAVKVFAVLLLITLGLLIFVAGFSWQHSEQVTGYKYRLVEDVSRQITIYAEKYLWHPIGHALIPTYRLLEFPVKTTISVFYIKEANVAWGLLLILLGLYLGAYWIAKATNREFGVE